MIPQSKFKPAWWLPGPHLQTIWANRIRPKPAITLKRERIELDDGDFIDLDWNDQQGGPLILILHGLEGSSNSNYAAGILRSFSQRGWTAVLMHFRGCSGEPNRLARRYHAGETDDLTLILELLRQRYPDRPVFAVGYSLGGNVLLKWLGETGENNPLSAALAISV
ncbi:MAG TPA: alpha/beta fold hydrolase, partial [Gammaproteobacteria bacterium]|nr:alpha/beta fold hydrolase [Gammaproteobacteria bacterium]